MKKIASNIIIRRPVEEVFAFVSNFENDTKWWLNVTESTIISKVRSGIGTQYKQSAQFMGQRFDSILEITEYVPPQQVTLRSIQSAIPFVAYFTFEAVPEGTRFTMIAQVQGTGFYKWVQPLFNRLLQSTTNKFFIKLKNLLENTGIDRV